MLVVLTDIHSTAEGNNSLTSPLFLVTIRSIELLTPSGDTVTTMGKPEGLEVPPELNIESFKEIKGANCYEKYSPSLDSTGTRCSVDCANCDACRQCWHYTCDLYHVGSCRAGVGIAEGRSCISLEGI